MHAYMQSKRSPEGGHVIKHYQNKVDRLELDVDDKKKERKKKKNAATQVYICIHMHIAYSQHIHAYVHTCMHACIDAYICGMSKKS